MAERRGERMADKKFYLKTPKRHVSWTCTCRWFLWFNV